MPWYVAVGWIFLTGFVLWVAGNCIYHWGWTTGFREAQNIWKPRRVR